ncbi:hypothetical protein [Hazenella coriacea]|uniref:Aminopyrimidine aminohydrolase n=1 Tax=Hazenella coriacea TaxID=1179467 RepID=A0A4R3LBY8_9BACL|nr:hypothetical protein [Hazenella coriacea]TCS96818.1 TENA/THI-4/PQQC family protein [Hazenella coriacea]
MTKDILLSLNKYENIHIDKLNEHPFFLKLLQGDLPIVTVKRFAVETILFYVNMFDFIVPILSWQDNPERKYFLTECYMRMLKVRPETLESNLAKLNINETELKNIMPLPANTAIKHHMLFLSLNDPTSFLICLKLCFYDCWRIDSVLNSLLQFKQYKEFHNIFDQIFYNFQLIGDPASNFPIEFNSYSKRNGMLALRNLIDTFVLFYDELLQADKEADRIDFSVLYNQ